MSEGDGDEAVGLNDDDDNAILPEDKLIVASVEAEAVEEDEEAEEETEKVEEVEDVPALVEQAVRMAAGVEGKNLTTGKGDGYKIFNVDELQPPTKRTETSKDKRREAGVSHLFLE